MSKIKQAIYTSNNIEEIDVTEEDIFDLEARGAVLILDYPTFAREYNPNEVYEEDNKSFPSEQE